MTLQQNEQIRVSKDARKEISDILSLDHVDDKIKLKMIEGILSRSRSSLAPLPDIDAREELHKILVGIHCPNNCGWKQVVPLDEWLFQSKYGHGYTCGSEKCPSHTYLVRDDPDEQVPACSRYLLSSDGDFVCDCGIVVRRRIQPPHVLLSPDEGSFLPKSIGKVDLQIRSVKMGFDDDLPGDTMTPKPELEYTCDTCTMFECPVLMKYPGTTGCNIGKDLMEQIKKSREAKSRDFEDVCKELGI